ncbi:MAG: hypothetical protein HY774_27015 [Acidobacteria bacterium]|nr:hypothetical protein [Acidobacteriota bacterium]
MSTDAFEYRYSQVQPYSSRTGGKMSRIILTLFILYTILPSSLLNLLNICKSIEEPQIIISDEMLCPYTLVRAEVISITEKPDKDIIIALVRILHVYKGPFDLKESIFQVEASISGLNSYKRWFSPSLQQGEIGIWSLHFAKDRYWAVWPRSGYFGQPARQIEPQSRYAETLVWAEAVETTLKAPAKERFLLIQKLVLSPVPELSSWAVTVLCQTKSPQTLRFLETVLSNKNFSVSGQIRLDEVFCDLMSEHWTDSIRRSSLIESWGKNIKNNYEAEKVINRLQIISQHNSLSDKCLVKAVTDIIENKEILIKTRIKSLNVIGWFPSRGRDKRLAFQFYLNLLEQEYEQELQIETARRISWLAVSNEEYLKVVFALKEKIKNKQVVETLLESLQQAQERKNDQKR